MATDTFLVLEDASVYAGKGIGAPAPEAGRIGAVMNEAGPLPAGTGELVFNTGMTGYHEIITDPSYTGQLVIMTSPHIGNYGDLEEWSETEGPSGAGGLIMRAAYRGPVPQGRMTLDGFLRQRGIPGISGIDTRALTLRIRQEGNLKGCIVRSSGNAAGPAGTGGDDDMGGADGNGSAGLTRQEIETCMRYLTAFPDMEGLDLVSVVGGQAGDQAAGSCQTADQAAYLGQAVDQAANCDQPAGSGPTEGDFIRRTGADVSGQKEGGGLHFVVVDFGIKQNILRELRTRGCRVTILPHDTTAAAVRSLGPDAVLLSNGPGDPAALTGTINMIGGLVGEFPLFGICLGHQLISLALGAKTYKLKFGHHSLNQPVIDTCSGKVFITSQNHGFAVREPENHKELEESQSAESRTAGLRGASAGAWPDGLRVWMRNANDGTVEGIRHDGLRIQAVQFHPEAAPGPRDTLWIFDEFIACARERS
ncbi:MAG: glutamine-hydrolyzing carbamoyl-phosphate synthase small subunit [Spirochaetota bacterium]|nr:glutamine-hydrolyzing carbamoyl-phosphate synthase small subunit [Spirochaetota bacterium]